MIKKTILYMIRLYKKYLSPFLPNACRYYPTCSEYTYTAVMKHGVIKGLFLGIWRILRCNPFAKGGYDPVP